MYFCKVMSLRLKTHSALYQPDTFLSNSARSTKFVLLPQGLKRHRNKKNDALRNYLKCVEKLPV